MDVQIIVALEAGSELDAYIDVAADAETGGPAFARLADRLSSMASIGLRPVQIASGRNVVLAIDVNRTAARLAERLAAVDAVTAVYRLERLAPPPETPALRFLLDLRPGASVDPGTSLGGVPLAEADVFSDPSRALVTVDGEAMLDAALERLETSPDVRFAQVNRILRQH